MALAAAGEADAFATLILRLRMLTISGDPIAGGVALPLALGLGAFAAGDYGEAVRRIAPLAADVVRLGGSNVQRSLFEETLREGWRRTGQSRPAPRSARIAGKDSPRAATVLESA